MTDELLTVLGQKHSLRVLLFLRGHDGARFSDVEHALALNPAQVDRALKSLSRGLWILAQTEPKKTGPIRVRYALSRRGSALLKSFDSFKASAEKQRPALGDEAVDELASLSA